MLPWALLPLLLLSAHPAGAGLNYVRPYLSALLVGSTLALPPGHPLGRLLAARTLKYLATISYALYVVHGCLVESWLASGSTAVKYLKRPLFLLVTFGLAHLSTRFYERFFIRLGRRWAGERPGAEPPGA